MVTFVFCLFLGASYALYTTSKVVDFKTPIVLGTWLQADPKRTKIIGVGGYVLGSVLSVFFFGYTSGILFSLVSILTFMSLLVVLYPLHIITYKHLLVFTCITLLIELLFTYAR